MIRIDGSAGEGGGQILRSSLALSLITGQPFRIEKIRARREKPGLARQHLTAVTAAASVGDAKVEGAAVGSTELTFTPREVKAGEYHFPVGTAGSTTLVFQTVLPPLMLASGPSTVVLEGGTHNMKAPPFDFIDRVFVPVARRMGGNVGLNLERHGFYPAGGGRFSALIEPGRKLLPLDLTRRGAIKRLRARASVVGLPRTIAERELNVVREALAWTDESLEVVEVEGGLSRGNFLTLEVESEHVTELFSAIGRTGVRAEQVAAEAVEETRRYLDHGAPVGEHLADQLILPLALAGGGRFATGPLSAHTTTNVEVVKTFLPVRIEVENRGETSVVTVTGRGGP